jgi:hypothetical protein
MDLHGALKLDESLALERFDDKIASRLQPPDREFERQLAQMHASRLIGRFDSA